MAHFTAQVLHYRLRVSVSSLQVALGWRGFCTASFTTAMAVVMAELVRQVEVHCSERAQAIALAWNTYTAAMDSCLSKICTVSLHCHANVQHGPYTLVRMDSCLSDLSCSQCASCCGTDAICC